MMKRTLITMTMIAVVAGLANAAILTNAVLVEEFDYDDGALDGNGSATDGWAGAWSGDWTVAGGAATSPNGVQEVASRSRDSLDTSDGMFYFFSIDIYSADYDPGSDSEMFVSVFNDSIHGPGFKIDNSQFRAAESWFSTSSTAVTLADNTGYTIVGKITFSDAGNDTVDLWVNTTGDTSTSGAADSSWAGGMDNIKQAITIRSDNGAAITLDNFSMTPEPATMALLGLGGLGVLCKRRRG